MVRRFLDLSSGHLSPDTWGWLDAQFADEELRDPKNLVACELAGGRTRTGWFIYAAEHPVNTVPDDLAGAFKEARKHGAEYLMFDCDAPPHPALPLIHPDFADHA